MMVSWVRSLEPTRQERNKFRKPFSGLQAHAVTHALINARDLKILALFDNVAQENLSPSSQAHWNHVSER